MEASSKSVSQAAKWRLRCIECQGECYDPRPGFRCESCGDLLEFFDADSSSFPADALKSLWRERKMSPASVDQSGVWRFREMLPALPNLESAITIREGNTPIYDMRSCARTTGVEQLYAKHLGMNPTGSFKDIGMTLAASFAREKGFRWVACASTGNTSASMAAYAARGGMRSLVLIPEGQVAWGKLSQALDYGAVTCQLRTDFDGCMRLLNEIVQRMPVYLLNSVNPYRIEGQKTAAFELMEQFDWHVPDHVIVPGGNLGNSSAIGKGFLEMKALGLIGSLPKISIIQAEGANPLVRAMRENGGQFLTPVRAETMATAIRIGAPTSWKKAVRVLRATAGTVEQVSEVEIADAKAEIGAEGIGCEPASAVTLGGFKKLVKKGFVRKDERVVLILTGHLLKDPDYTIKFHRGDLFPKEQGLVSGRRAPVILDPDAESILRILQNENKPGEV